jgi:hypothetical protein
LPIVLILSGHFSVLGIVWLRGAKQGLKRDQSCSDGQGWSPLVFKNVQADRTGLGADIWMPYLCVELHFWWFERVVLRNLNVDIKDSSLVRGVRLKMKFG